MASATTRSELSKVYEPREVESVLYAKWQQCGYFQPSNASSEPNSKQGEPDTFTVVLPPPNITGRLHMGHALTATIEDCLVRWHRMRGFSTLWIPGSDHAGIATQVMVERELGKEGTSRHEVGRSAFIDRVWDWQKQHGGIIDDQHRRLGASLDWTRYRFTMDETSSRAVREAFCRLYEQGLIYRDYRLINWDHASQTALSDLEVEHREVQGKLWHIAYPVEGSEEKLIVATTRPETMLGDTGVAVHPEDPRYRHLIGKFVILPLCGRKIPIVGDSILVDMSFGTGAVKVTPAHDFNDFETGKRHDLELISVIDIHGKMCAPVPDALIGVEVSKARSQVLAMLKEAGALVKIEDHKLNVGYSQRTGVVVEPLPSFQWFVNVKPMAQMAIDAVRNEETSILPAHRTQDFYRWMENIHDWCVSRQLWWGHQIPAWHCRSCEKITVCRSVVESCEHCDSSDIFQDPDVLDTWFSSGLWPLTTLGWPDDSVDLSRFYPTSLMETGWDILFFWVARMMMFGLHFTGKSPFKTVYLHSMVLGEDGQKMSKTKGNVVDPITLIDEYGVDALRFYLCTMAGQESGIVFSRARVEGYRNFCNKLWNVSRFALMNLDDFDASTFAKVIENNRQYEALTTADRWILCRALQVSDEVNGQLDTFRLDLAAHTLYQFVWSEFCDWYVEIAKLQLRADRSADERSLTQGVLVTVLDIVLRLLHPIMPFITEAIWTQLPRVMPAEASLMIANYPQGNRTGNPANTKPGPMASAGEGFLNDSLVTQSLQQIQRMMEIVTTARMLRSESRINPSQKVDLVLRAQSSALFEEIEASSSMIVHLARLARITVLKSEQEIPKHSATSLVDGIEVVLPLADLIDLKEEQSRLSKSVAQIEKDLAALTKKLGNENFLKKAPADVVRSEQERLTSLQENLAKQHQLLERLR